MTAIFTFQQFGQLLFSCIHTAGFCKEKNNTRTWKHKEMSESTKVAMKMAELLSVHAQR